MAVKTEHITSNFLGFIGAVAGESWDITHLAGLFTTTVTGS